MRKTEDVNTDIRFLESIRDRIIYVYKESPNVDFVHGLNRVIANMGECSYCGTVEPVVPLRELNRVYILKVFWHFERNAARTARALGVGRTTIYRLLAKYKIKLATQQ